MPSPRSRPTIGSNSDGGTARTTWWGQLSMATAASSAPASRQSASTRCRSAATATRSGLGQVAGCFEAAKDRAEPAELLLEGAVGREDPRRGEGQQLAAAVADHRVGPQLEPGQELIHGPLGVQDDVHRRRRRPELFVALVGTAEECSLGGIGSPTSRAMRSAVSKSRRTTGKWMHRVGEHAGILRALARKEERQASGAGVNERLVPEIDAAARRGSSGRPGRSMSRQDGASRSASSASDRRDDSQAQRRRRDVRLNAIQGKRDVLECLMPAAFSASRAARAPARPSRRDRARRAGWPRCPTFAGHRASRRRRRGRVPRARRGR